MRRTYGFGRTIVGIIIVFLLLLIVVLLVLLLKLLGFSAS